MHGNGSDIGDIVVDIDLVIMVVMILMIVVKYINIYGAWTIFMVLPLTMTMKAVMFTRNFLNMEHLNCFHS